MLSLKQWRNQHESIHNKILEILGTSMGGGFYAARITIVDATYDLIISHRAEGSLEQRRRTRWSQSTYLNKGETIMTLLIKVSGSNDVSIPPAPDDVVVYCNAWTGAAVNWERCGTEADDCPFNHLSIFRRNP